MSALANNFKGKFAGILRGILQRMDNGEGGEPQPARSAPPGNVPYQATVAQKASAPRAAADPAAQADAPAATPAQAGASDLEMPLLPVLEKLPADLRSKWILGGVDMSRATISISTEKILPQLALGAVKITFGELRNAAPTLFRAGEEYDSLPIILPLNEVLARLDPAMMARSPARKTVAVPAEIAAPFGPGGQGAAFANTLLKSPQPNPTTHFSPNRKGSDEASPLQGIQPSPTTHFFRKVPPPESAPIKMPTPPAIAQPPVKPTSVTPPSIKPASVAPPSVTPPIPFGQRAVTPSAGAPDAPTLPRATRSGPAFPTPPTPASDWPQIPDVAPIPFKKPIPFKPIAAATSPPSLEPSEPVATPVILAPLAALSEEWPEPLRLEIMDLDLAEAQVALPVHLIEPALKRGRVIFSWQYLRTWIRPNPPGVSIHDAVELELPLKVLAPLFLPRQKNGAKRQATMPPSSVPNLFFGFPQPQPEELIAPLNMADTVSPAKPLDTKLAESNYYVWGDGADTPRVDETEYKRAPAAPATDFSSRQAMPQDIVARAMKLPGVAGAIVALPDGLKVAHQVPANVNPDTVAAFLPQLFSRVTQCCKELRMGEVNNLNFTTGHVPWKIFRVNAVYFAAFGQAGEPLPTAQLAALAAELDRKK